MSETNQRSQKLASAIYLITGFFSDQEPLKWKLRTLSADLVSERVKDKFGLVREMLSLFSIALNAGLVSELNHQIIARELSKFGESLESPLNKIFFPEPEREERALPQPVRHEPIKDKIVESHTEREDKSTLKEFGAVSVKKNSRQNVIISLLKRKKEIMIKDVSTLIEDCSEKTIQRELLAMVASGVLRKIGEKRWSRYSLA